MSSDRAVTGVPGVPDHRLVELSPKRHDLALVIPVINEGDRLLGQLGRLQLSAPEVDVVVADGGSTDGSTDPQRLAELGVSALLVKTGPGKLSAQLRTAVHFCLLREYAGVLTMDGNGKDGVEGVARVVAALREGADFVQGSRFIPGGEAENTPLLRWLAIRALHAPAISLAARHRFTDTTNGFRGHSARLLTDPRVAPLRDVFDTYELLAYLPVQAARLGYRCTEVPVARRYPHAGAVPTKIHGVSAQLRLLRILRDAVAGRYAPE